jgi:ATP-dependent exoDNAse (exonuclease V) beta subunit
MQWENFLPLIRNTVSSGGDAILFGDVKQAIYRFRNGDSELLQALSSKEGFEKSMGRNSNEKEYEMLNLDCNYRSSEEVINYNNQYFSKLIEPGGDFEVAQAYYADVVQNKPPTKTSERTGFIVEKNRQSEEDRTIFFEREIVEAVEDAIKTGHQAKDIAILTRGRASGSEYARLLTKKGYAVISSDSLLLNSSIEVRTLIAALQLLLNPKHPIAALQLELYKKAKGNNEQNTSLTTDKTVKDEKAKDLLEKPLYSMVRSLLSVLKMNINERFMIAFLDEVLKFSQKGSGSLSDFLDWWQEKKDSLSLTLPKETDAITITTIHKAKGLEYPIVILPLKSLSNRSSKTEFWYKNTDKTTEISWVPISINKELEGTRFDIIYQEEKQRQVIDNINIIYVAMTRAREGMYLLRG